MLLATALGLASACQAPTMLELGDPADLGRPIIGGMASGAGDHPSVGVILAVGIMGQYGIGSMLCTGTLIAPDVVLTAGHCTENPFEGYTSDFEFYFSFSRDVRSFGESSLDFPPQTYAVAQAIPHPNWTMSVLNNFTGGLADFKDIALLILEEPVTEVAPSILLEADDSSSVAIDANVEIAGYGQTDAADQNSHGIKFHATSHINETGNSEMQIGDSPPGDAQKCHGDSGGPTFLEISDGKDPSLRLVGVTSHAYDETDCYRGGVDTRVDTYLAWIKQTMVSTCDSGLRSYCAGGGEPDAPVAPPQPDPEPDPDPVPDPDPTDPPPTGPPPGENPEIGSPPGGDRPADEIRRLGNGHACAAGPSADAPLALFLAMLGLAMLRRRR